MVILEKNNSVAQIDKLNNLILDMYALGSLRSIIKWVN